MLSKETAGQGRAFIERYGKGEAAKGASKRPHAQAFDAARPFSQEGLMIEVCFRAGGCRFFDSTACMDAAYEKGDTILALYSTAILQIDGRNLGDLASLIKERRVEYVQEQHDDYAPDETPYIEAITLHHPDLWEELTEELTQNGRIAPRARERRGHA